MLPYHDPAKEAWRERLACLLTARAEGKTDAVYWPPVEGAHKPQANKHPPV